VPKRPAAYLLQADPARLHEVPLERCLQAASEARVVHDQKHLVVQLEGELVEVGGADDRPPAVDRYGLGVQHRALVLVELHIALEEAPIPREAREPDRGGVVVGVRDEEPNADPALDGAPMLSIKSSSGRK
jgi:hypothetical protein